MALAYQKPGIEGGVVLGSIPILDVQFGNVWTNIDHATFERLGVGKANGSRCASSTGRAGVRRAMSYVSTFGDVPEGEPLLYLNSVDDVALAINWGDFAQTYGVESGPRVAHRGGQALTRRVPGGVTSCTTTGARHARRPCHDPGRRGRHHLRPGAARGAARRVSGADPVPERKRLDLPLHDAHWDDSVSLRREDIYGPDGR